MPLENGSSKAFGVIFNELLKFSTYEAWTFHFKGSVLVGRVSDKDTLELCPIHKFLCLIFIFIFIFKFWTRGDTTRKLCGHGWEVFLRRKMVQPFMLDQI